MLIQTFAKWIFLLLALTLGFSVSPQTVLAAPLAEEGQLYLPIIANGGAQTVTPTPVTPETPTPETPPLESATPKNEWTDQDLIAEALAAGRIDYGTSLLYRAYALFADERLPSELRGAGSTGEDQAFFRAATAVNLPAEIKRQLRPFLLRPDNPESVHSLRPISSPGQVGAADVRVACTGQWAAESSAQPGVKIRVHSRCNGDYTGDIQKVLGMLETLWTPMTQHMGKPQPDSGGVEGGGTDDIDIYLLEPLGVIVRNGNTYSITNGIMAAAVATEPYKDVHASSFMLVGRNDIGSKGFKSTLAHEFFHVLQDAHNYDVSFHDDTEWWFTEASATWAEANFVPETSAEEVHWRFTGTFKRRDNPLHLSINTADEVQAENIESMYASYIWPFFMQQELGEKVIATVWQKLEGVGEDWDKALQVVGEPLPFASNFHRFAFRNINNSFGQDNPLGKRYVDLDPHFPDGVLPKERYTTYLTPMAPNKTLALKDTIPALRAHYYHFTVDPAVQQVVFDFTKLQPLLDRKIGALVKIKGKPWQMRELVADVISFCRDNPEEDLEELWIVASHDKIDINSKIKGALEVRASEEPCGCDPAKVAEFLNVDAWRGHITFEYSQQATKGNRSVTIQEQADVYSQLERYADFSYIGKVVTGTGQINYVETLNKDVMEEFNGFGPPIPYDTVINGATQFSRLTLNFRPRDCTYSFGATVYIMATNTAGQQVPLPIGSVGGWFSPLPEGRLTLGTSAAFPVHTEDFILNYQGNFFSAHEDLALLDLLGEDNLGKAQITWSFTPLTAPGQNGGAEAVDR